MRKREEGVEPSSSAPQTDILPLNYNRHVKTRDMRYKKVIKGFSLLSVMKKNIIVLASFVILVFLVVVTLFYWENQGRGRDSNLIGDGVCSNLISDEGQDACCFNIHKDDVTIECVGKWQYVDGLRQCQFICNNAMPVCTEGAKLCDDGTSVVRNASLGCEFNACPSFYNNQEACEGAGGQWNIWENAPNPAPSCNLPTSDAGSECTQNTDCESYCQLHEDASGNYSSGFCYGWTLYDCTYNINRSGESVPIICS